MQRVNGGGEKGERMRVIEEVIELQLREKDSNTRDERLKRFGRRSSPTGQREGRQVVSCESR